MKEGRNGGREGKWERRRGGKRRWRGQRRKDMLIKKESMRGK